MATPLSYRLVLTGDVDETFIVSRLKPLTIGREADVRVRDPKASRVNARIELTERGLEIQDLRSLNGTLVNGERVKRCPLKDGDVIRIGDAVVRVKVEPIERSVAPMLKATMARTAMMPEGLFESGPMPALALGVDPALMKTLEAEGFSGLELVSREGPLQILHAVRTVLEQPVTLKVLDAQDAPPKEAERLLGEAKALARLNHPSIVRLLDARMAGRLIYMILERLPGRTLKAEVAPGEPMGAQRALALALPIARALAYAHQEGARHLDLALDQISLGRRDKDDEVKVMGFSLATPAAGEAGEAGAAGEASEVRGLGRVLYHLVTGEAPAAEAPAPVEVGAPSLPPRLVKLINKALRDVPSERFASSREMLTTIEAAIREAFGFQEGSANVDLLVRYAQAGPASGDLHATSPEGEAPVASAGAAGAAGAGAGAASGRVAGPPTFLGNFAENELVELVQMVEINQKSGLLEVVDADGGIGRVAFDQGLAVRARYRAASGREALIGMLSLQGGRFRLTVEPVTGAAEHRLMIGPVLLEVMRLRDEACFATA